MNQTYTKTPWAYKNRYITGPLDELEQGYPVICEIHGTKEQVEARGKLIVKCVNSRDELVEALKPFANITNIPNGSQFNGMDVNRAEQALLKAGAK